MDAGSGAVTIDAASVCRSINATGYTNTLNHGAFSLTIGDSTAGTGNIALKLVAGMTYTTVSSSTTTFVSTSTTQQTVDFAGKTIRTTTFNGVGGSWIFTGTPFVPASANMSVIHSAGTLNTGGQTLTVGSFSSSGSATCVRTITNSTITLTGTGTVWSETTGTTLITTGSTIIVNGASPIFSGAGETFNNLSCPCTGTLAINGADTFNGNVTINGPSIVTLNSNPTFKGLLTLGPTAQAFQSNIGSTQRTVALSTTGTVALTNITFTDIKFTGTNTPVSGTGLVNGGDNSGINFSSSGAFLTMM